MSIPADTFFVTTPATNFKSKAEAQLAGIDYFFYVADNHDLLVKTFEGNVSYTLASNVKWVDVIPTTDRIHVYYLTAANRIMHLVFEQFGAGNLTATDTGVDGVLTTFSVNYAANSTPPAYLLLFDDGVNHVLCVASDPNFLLLLAPAGLVVYRNSNSAYNVTRPTIAVHPLDTNVATINVQQIRISDNDTKVGFYVVPIPGVTG